VSLQEGITIAVVNAHTQSDFWGSGAKCAPASRNSVSTSLTTRLPGRGSPSLPR
jgi:hypothetical protein